MIFLIRVITEGAVQRNCRLHLKRSLWLELTSELHSRTEAFHESGAFLLGQKFEDHRRAQAIIYYDELDPFAYESGVCVLHAAAFSELWGRCAALNMTVVADAHVHGRRAGQSRSDRENPMIARPGHIALILPLMARAPVRRWSVGYYEYLGDHKWNAHGGCQVSRVLKIED
jgi:hypothetical protein